MFKYLNFIRSRLVVHTSFVFVFAFSFLTHAEVSVLHRSAKERVTPYYTHPLAPYLTEEKYREMNSVNKRQKIEVVTINTSDLSACLEFKDHYQIHDDLCSQNSDNPYVSLLVVKNVSADQFENSVSFNSLDPKEKIFLKELRNLSLMGAGVFGLIYALPEEISKWDKSKGFSGMIDNYSENIKAGPVVDKDDWAVNYIGHPLSGAAYYTLVRHQGYSAMESFGYSVVMSTFFWEYGIEAIAEIPSIQDLIITPIIGSLIGEGFFRLKHRITENGGTLLGSKKFANFMTVVMNPAGALSNKINKAMGTRFVKDVQFNTTMESGRNSKSTIHNLSSPNKLKLQLKILF